jgi:hypothetical protein
MEWAHEHPYLTALLAYCALYVSATMVNRVLRTVKVLVRGWPPAHLDADGDWRPQQERQD